MNKVVRILVPILVLSIIGGAIYITIVLLSPPTPLPVNAPATAPESERFAEPPCW